MATKKARSVTTKRPATLHIKKGDKVLVISGKDKGLTGTVMLTYPKTGRVLVEGINRITKHTRVGSSSRGTKTGGIVTREAPVHISNVMLAVDVDGKTVGTRVGYRFDEEGNKIRFAKRNGEDI